jgi:hypothetical protein
MDHRDLELLDKQMRRFDPPARNDGAMILAVTAVFFAGMTLGGFLFAYKGAPTRIALNDTTAAISLPYAAPPVMRQ